MAQTTDIAKLSIEPRWWFYPAVFLTCLWEHVGLPINTDKASRFLMGGLRVKAT